MSIILLRLICLNWSIYYGKTMLFVRTLFVLMSYNFSVYFILQNTYNYFRKFITGIWICSLWI